MKYWVALFLCFSMSCQAADLGTIGNTYPIAETNILEWIKTKLNQWQQSGELALHQQAFEKRSLQTIHQPKPVNVTRTTEARTFIFDPSLTVEQDIRDTQGKLIHRAGDKVNPLDQVSLSKQLVFFDATDKEQLAWAKQYLGQSKLILTNGSPIELMKQHQQPFYFDQHGSITTKLGIQHVPALVSQQGKVLKIEEVKL